MNFKTWDLHLITHDYSFLFNGDTFGTLLQVHEYFSWIIRTFGDTSGTPRLETGFLQSCYLCAPQRITHLLRRTLDASSYEFSEQRNAQIETSHPCVSHGEETLGAAALISSDRAEDIYQCAPRRSGQHTTPGRGGLGAVSGDLDAEVLNVQPSDCDSSGWAATWGPGSCCCCCSQRPFCGSGTPR